MKRIIAVTSGHSQVGKTCVALNLSIAIKKSGASVCLLDASSGFNNSAALIGVKPKHTFLDFLYDGASLDEVAIEGPSGVTIIPGGFGFQNFTQRASDRESIILKEIKSLEKFDYMIVDTSAGISIDNIALSRAADLVVNVFNQEADAIVDGLVGMKILLDHNYSKGVVLLPNMFEYDFNSKALAQKVEEASKKNMNQRIQSFPILYMDEAVPGSVVDKKPFIVTHPVCPASVGIKKMSISLVKNNNDNSKCDPGKYIFDVAKYSLDSNLAALVDKQKSYKNGEDIFRNLILEALGFPPVEKTKESAKIDNSSVAVEFKDQSSMEASPSASKYIVDIFEKNVQAQEKILVLLENIAGGSSSSSKEKNADQEKIANPVSDFSSGKTFFLDFDEYLSKRED